MDIDEEILEMLEVYIKVQNIQLLKYIAQCEGWDFKTYVKIICNIIYIYNFQHYHRFS